jgi:predicted DNA-binding transcriptional regulator AlpA
MQRLRYFRFRSYLSVFNEMGVNSPLTIAHFPLDKACILEQRGKTSMGGLISEAELSRILQLSVSSLRNMRQQGRGPKFYLLGLRKIGYRQADIEEWLATRANTLPPSRSARAECPAVPAMATA